jgi:hypothetical protein
LLLLLQTAACACQFAANQAAPPHTCSPTPLPPLAAGILRNIDHAGVSVIEALEQAGFDPSPASLRKMIIPKDKVGCSGWVGFW